MYVHMYEEKLRILDLLVGRWDGRKVLILAPLPKSKKKNPGKFRGPSIQNKPCTFSSTSRIGVGIHDSRAGGGSRTAGEEVQGEEQDQAGVVNDQP